MTDDGVADSFFVPTKSTKAYADTFDLRPSEYSNIQVLRIHPPFFVPTKMSVTGAANVDAAVTRKLPIHDGFFI